MTGTSATLQAADTILDQTTTDNDVLNLTLTAENLAGRVSGIETVNVNWDAFSDASVAAATISGATINLTSAKLGFLGNATVKDAGANNVVAGDGMKGNLVVTNVTTGTVAATAAKTVTVDAKNGTADDTTTVTAGATTTTMTVGNTTAFDNATVVAGAATTDITVKGDKTVSVTAGAATKAITTTSNAATIDASAAAKDAVVTVNNGADASTASVTLGNDATVTSTLAGTEKLTLDVAAGKTVTLTGLVGAETLEVKGAGDVTLKATAANLTTDTVTKSNAGTLTVDLTGTALNVAVDTAKVAADLFKVKAAAATGAILTAKSGQTFEVSAESATADLTVGVKTDSTADALNVKLTSAQYAAIKQGANDIETLTIEAAAAQATGDATAIDLTIADLVAGADNKVVLTGTNDVKLTKVTSAKEIDATALNGTLNVGAGAAVTEGVIAGATGVNTIAFGAIAAGKSVTFIGQAGKDVVTLTSTAVAGGGSAAGQANIVLGAGDDKLTAGAIAGVLSVQAGDGNDTVELTGDPTGTVVIEFGAGSDTLVLAANADVSAANLTLTDLETIQLKATGNLTFAGSQITGKTWAIKGTNGTTDKIIVKAAVGTADENIDLSGLVVTDSVATGIVGATLTGNNGKNVLTGTSRNDEITGGQGDDTIQLGAGGNDTVRFELVANNGKDTIVGFNAGTDALTKDVLTVSDLATLGTNGSKTVFQKANASSADKASVVTATGITTNGNGVITLKDQAAADWSDVATVIGNALTVDGTAGNNSEFVILVDNGTDTRIYSYKDVANGFDAGDITLVGTVSAVQTYTTTGVFDATNFA